MTGGRASGSGFRSRVLLELVSGHSALGGRDAVHAATALMAGLPGIISLDRGFDGIAGLVRVDLSAAVPD